MADLEYFSTDGLFRLESKMAMWAGFVSDEAQNLDSLFEQIRDEGNMNGRVFELISQHLKVAASEIESASAIAGSAAEAFALSESPVKRSYMPPE